MDGARNGLLAFAGFPKSPLAEDLIHQPLERINNEVKRRSRVVGILLNEASAIRLVGDILADLYDEWQANDFHYRSEDSLSLLDPQSDSLVAAGLTAGN